MQLGRLQHMSLQAASSGTWRHRRKLAKLHSMGHCAGYQAGSYGFSFYGCSAGVNGEETTRQCRRRKRCGFSPRVGKIPWRTPWPPTPVFLPGESYGQRRLGGYGPWGRRVRQDCSDSARMHAWTSQPSVPWFSWHKMKGFQHKVTSERLIISKDIGLIEERYYLRHGLEFMCNHKL